MHEPCHYYILPIGGTATAALAGLLHEAGERVSGVDSALYPPMSEMLAEAGIPVRLGYDPAKIPPDADRIIIGNAIPRDNIEVQAVLSRSLPYTSQAAELGERFCRSARTVVVAGTHGKTTTTALTAHIFAACGLDPTVLVGGVPRGGKPWRLGRGSWTVVEGDEYNTAFFDRGPKFLHYYPHIFVVGNVEFDHGDIYPDLAAILAVFRAGTARVDDRGHVLFNAGDSGASEVAVGHPRALSYGSGNGAWLRCVRWGHVDGHLEASCDWEGQQFEIAVPLVGRHNLDNLLASFASALLAGLQPADIATAVASFPGVRRRLEVIGTAAGVTVVDDFAHHPTAVGLTLEGARQRFAGRRIVVVFEPRSLTAGRGAFFGQYVEAFSHADCALIAPVFHRARLQPGEVLDRGALVTALRGRGVEASALAEDVDRVAAVRAHLAAGDVVICMSSGDFGGLPAKLLARLGEAQ